MNKKLLAVAKNLIGTELSSDIGSGDITTNILFPDKAVGKAKIISKDDGILCGIEIARLVFKVLDKKIVFKIRKKDGAAIKKGDVLAEVKGRLKAILSGERTALNFLQHLSGIATKSKMAVSALSDSRIKILDTRKTIPGLRALQKYAAKIGGACNHRFGLYDGILIKNNHLRFYDIGKAVKIIKRKYPREKIEVEVRNLDEVKEAVSSGAGIILLDNFKIKDIKRAIKMIDKKAKIEVSGGIAIAKLKNFKWLGIDFISMGCLTHSVRALDICLRMTL